MKMKVIIIGILFLMMISACKKDKQPTTDVYLVGQQSISGDENIAILVKNGKITALGTPAYISAATSIVVKNNDVFIGGSTRRVLGEKSIAKYWKNGTETTLTSGTYNASVRSIDVDENNFSEKKEDLGKVITKVDSIVNGLF